MDRFEAMTAFVAVAEQGSFANASRHLGISSPTISRSIAGLEQHLGVSLFHRNTRSVNLTDQGIAFLAQAREMLQQWSDAEHVVMDGQSEPRGEFHVTAPVVFGRLHVLPVLTDLLSQHADMSARVMLLDRNIRIVEEGVDVAVRIGELRDSSLIATTIGSVHQTIIASPAYLSKHGRPNRPEDLAKLQLVAAGDSIRGGSQWRFGEKQDIPIQVVPRITVNSVDAVLAAVRNGLGIGNVLSYQAAEGIAAGDLCQLLEDFRSPPIPVNLVFHSSRAKLPAVRRFVELMRLRAKEGFWD